MQLSRSHEKESAMHIRHEYHIIKMDALPTRSIGPVHQKHYIVSVVSPGGTTPTLLRTDNAEAAG